MKYSIIIPVYNAEKTIRRCVDSLLNEGYADAEIILVNDGSRDGSGVICEEYAKNNSSVRYIAQPNGGVSSARNTGLDAARGENILFVDSDDYVVSDFFSLIDSTVEESGADLIQFSNSVDNGIEKTNSVCFPLYMASREELLPRIVDAICRKKINSPWAKLFRRRIIEEHHIRFPLGVSVAEDRAFNIVYSFYMRNYAVSERITYVLNTENENSLSRKRHSDLQKQFEIADEYLDRELTAAPIPDREKDCYREALDFGICRGIYHDAKLLHQDHAGWFSRQKRLLELCRQINGKHMRYPKTRYCTGITLPVRLYLTPVIDAMAAVLVKRRND